ncbi:MAG TPA: acetyl-CoA C-acyltransferase, partial [Blastocatellia bacterium]|nr:acetyl-CoA C-acyltransferase [Blastocatellia bacterium]
MKDAVIVSALRTAVGKAPRGVLKDTRPDDMAGTVIKAAIEHTPGLQPEMIEDVILGCAMPEAEQGMNVARQASWLAGVPKEAAAVTINRFCSSGLQAIAFAAERIMCGWADCIVAGGTETMSMVPMGGNKIVPNPTLVDTWPDYYLNMGLTAENLAAKYSISRREADEFSLRSHQKAVEAINAGKFKDEIVPLNVKAVELDAKGKRAVKESVFDTDEGPRADTSIDALGKLRPAFHARGTVTAGNSSQMSDGAAVSVVMSADRARELGLKPLARLIAFATAGVSPDYMGIGPVAAVPKALKIAGLN